MVERAAALNRKRTAARITSCAQDLAEERGLDGFTMEDLAERAGVSRRTLFNYVSGKHDAVLGSPPPPDPSRLLTFRSGGPTGNLAEDLKVTLVAVLDSRSMDSDELERVRRLVASDGRLHKTLHDKFEKVATLIAEAIVEREPDRFDALRARAAATVTIAVFDLALEAYVQDPSVNLADHYIAAFDGAAALFT